MQQTFKVCNRCRRPRPADTFIDPVTGTKRRSCVKCRPEVKRTKNGDTYTVKDKHVCDRCGCTEREPCHDQAIGGPCFWVTPSKNICSCCARKKHLPTDPPVSSPELHVRDSDLTHSPSFAGPQGDRLGGDE